ncbi:MULTISPECIES: glycosyltransferase family 2 protein [Moraxella]|uniref:Lipopolysaccharide core biosynthesis glycosyl transferase kdtX n=1 Tax=Moraxella catarrhalis TaxID=480 RepID=A0A7Z1A535_MORCA|nr:glycosyltransferase family 2 protein [Moraxella catarrhalis]OAV02089.1 Lipopolysaccharide core biosynthesis glycosyl transferase kdtX [Moraxella catarrhalis]STY82011.1 SPBc2 prophage-derived glycosyltransferase SunS [Moraxella catarrhalis]
MNAAKPHRLSVVMIVKNEAHNLALSLPSVAEFADEIIILDSGSTDNSRDIAESFGAKWYVNTDWQGFGKQRQLAQSHATGEWILALDADEVVTPTLKNSILQTINNPPANTVYGIKRLDFVFGHQIDNALWGVKAHWRLYPKHFGYDNNLVHESVVLTGANTAKLDGFLEHHTAPTPKFWLEKRLDYAKAWADDRHAQGKTSKFYKVVLNPLWAFVKQYVIDGRFLQGRYGLIYSLMFSQYTFNKYACLYDLSHNQAEQAFLNSVAMTKNLQPIDLSQKKSTLSLVMICKNESKHLKACLDTVHDIADEIIILDSGSTDNTRQIAESFGAKWHVNTDWQGFGKQRQLAQSYATGDYVLVLDADERLDQTLRESIAKVLSLPVQTDKVFSVARVNTFCGVEVQPRRWYTDKLARLYARKFGYCDLKVHESLDQQGVPSQVLDGYLPHITNDNLHHFLVKNIRYSHDWAQEKHAKGKQVSLFGIMGRSLVSFLREYVLRADFSGGAYGYILAAASMGYTLDKYIMLWQMNQEN